MRIKKGINLARYKQIITAFGRHGFELLMSQVGILKYLKMKKRDSNAGDELNNSKLSTGERLRLTLEELGPTFVKLGQILSTRLDLFPLEVVEELKKLQDSVQPFPFPEVKALIENEFDNKLENIYKEFEEKPFASASIAQVHYARLNSGKQVAVKVQRPGIEKIIDIDLNILKDIAYFIDNHTRYGKMYEFTNVVIEFENTLKNELDFTKEGQNAETFKKNFIKEKEIAVPEIKWIYTTRQILTMEYIDGVRIDDFEKLEQAGINKKRLGRKLAASIFNQIIRDGFFHADPHPGNIKILPDGTIVFLDFGMVGVLSESRKRAITKFFIGVTYRESNLVVKALVDLDNQPKSHNLKKLEYDVDIIIDKYLTMPLNQIKLGNLLSEIFNLAFLNNIKIPQEFALLSKTLATVQLLLESLDPDINVFVIAKPIAGKIAYRFISPEILRKNIRKNLLNYGDLFDQFPSVMLNFLNKMEEKDFIFQYEIKDIDSIQKRFDRALNRISFCVVLLAVSIIIAGIIVGSSLSADIGVEMYVLNSTILKIGLVIAIIIVLWLVFSMLRSSRL
ncbi:MAG: ABC1 kinase family protein [Deltaproteobacteria bacterium]